MGPAGVRAETARALPVLGSSRWAAGAQRSGDMGSFRELEALQHRKQIPQFIGKTGDKRPERRGGGIQQRPFGGRKALLRGRSQRPTQRKGRVQSQAAAASSRTRGAEEGLMGMSRLWCILRTRGQELPRHRCSQLEVGTVARLAGRRGFSGSLLGLPNTFPGRRNPFHRWC